MIKNKKAFSLIELIITILILAIIGGMSVAFFTPLVNLFFYSPTQLMVDNTAQELTHILIEGDHLAKGLRFSKSISINGAYEDTIRFTTSDNDTVIYRWDVTEERIYRNINAQGESLIPYSYYGNIVVTGDPTTSEIFQYYDSSDLKLSTPVGTETQIESIRFNIIVQSGSGIVTQNQGRVKLRAGIDIKQFN